MFCVYIACVGTVYTFINAVLLLRVCGFTLAFWIALSLFVCVVFVWCFGVMIGCLLFLCFRLHFGLIGFLGAVGIK